MTLYCTPGGTPLNNTGFQGTQPGNAVQAALQVANIGVGLFPPTSGESSQASTQQPINTLTLQGGASPVYGG